MCKKIEKLKIGALELCKAPISDRVWIQWKGKNDGPIFYSEEGEFGGQWQPPSGFDMKGKLKNYKYSSKETNLERDSSVKDVDSVNVDLIKSRDNEMASSIYASQVESDFQGLSLESSHYQNGVNTKYFGVERKTVNDLNASQEKVKTFYNQLRQGYTNAQTLQIDLKKTKEKSGTEISYQPPERASNNTINDDNMVDVIVTPGLSNEVRHVIYFFRIAIIFDYFATYMCIYILTHIRNLLKRIITGQIILQSKCQPEIATLPIASILKVTVKRVKMRVL